MGIPITPNINQTAKQTVNATVLTSNTLTLLPVPIIRPS
jgi:hypothetical protein